MPRKPGVSNVRATAPRSISGGAAPSVLASASLDSRSRLFQRMTHSLERAFEYSKHMFGSGCDPGGGDRVLASVGTRLVSGSGVVEKGTGTKSERLDKPPSVGDS